MKITTMSILIKNIKYIVNITILYGKAVQISPKFIKH